MACASKHVFCEGFFSHLGKDKPKPIALGTKFNIKDTHREQVPSNKTPALTKSSNMGILVFVTLNQLFIRGS